MNDSPHSDSCSPARILITGAAGGVGRECAIAFAKLGADMVLCDYDGCALQRIAAQTGGLGRFCDVASEASAEIFAADLLAGAPTLDILVNAAGDAYVRSLGMMRMSRLLMPALRRGGAGSLIANVAPGRGLGASIGLFAHAGSEAAFARLSEAIAIDSKGSSVTTATVTRSSAVGTSIRELHLDVPKAAIAIALDRFDPAAVAARIVELACDVVPALDCSWSPANLLRRAGRRG